MQQQGNYRNAIKGVRQRIINFNACLKRNINWNIKYYNLKYFKGINTMKLVINHFFVIVFYTIVLTLFMIYISDTTEIKDLFFNITKITKMSFNASDLVNQQISITLLVLTVVSLMANIDNKYIFGEKAIEVIFNKNGILSIKSIFNILILMMFINISLSIKNGNDLLILICFICSTLLITFITFKFTTIYTNPHKIRTKWKIKYLKENKKHLCKAKPLDPNLSVKLENFKNITIQYIKQDDLRYIENINVYFELLRVSLFNDKKLIQEYYTEAINYGDFISNIALFAEVLYRENKIEESIRVYSNLYHQLNYNEIVLVRDHINNLRIRQYIELSRSVKDKIEAQDIHYKIFNLIELYWKQLYLYTVIDLSYCRLAKCDRGLIYYFTYSDVLETYYCSIIENKNLNKEEKKIFIECLYDSIRVLRVDKTLEWSTVTNFKDKEMFNMRKIEYPQYLYVEPITLMMLKIIEKKDFNSFALFLTMNLEDLMMKYMKLLCILSLIESSIRGKKQYYLDIEISIDELKKILDLSNIKSIKVDIEELKWLYEEFTLRYLKDKNKINSKEHIYSFHPRLSFNMDTIKALSYYIAELNELENDIQEIYHLKNEASISIIDSYIKI